MKIATRTNAFTFKGQIHIFMFIIVGCNSQPTLYKNAASSMCAYYIILHVLGNIPEQKTILFLHNLNYLTTQSMGAGRA
jgi:hypothetical protein